MAAATLGRGPGDPIIHKLDGLGHRQLGLLMSLADEEDESATRDVCLIDSSARGWAIDVSTRPCGIEGTAASLGALVDQLNDIAGSDRVRGRRLADRITHEVSTLLFLIAQFGCSYDAIKELHAFTGARTQMRVRSQVGRAWTSPAECHRGPDSVVAPACERCGGAATGTADIGGRTVMVCGTVCLDILCAEAKS